MFFFLLIVKALFHLIRIFKIFFFFALIMGALIWYRGKAGLMYIAVWESQRPSPLALQKSICFLQCYVCATWLCEAGACPKQQCYSDWVAPIVMTRAQSAKKIKKSKILISCRVYSTIKRKKNTNHKYEHDAFHFGMRMVSGKSILFCKCLLLLSRKEFFKWNKLKKS